jgi:hypothetical protein
MLRVGDKVEIGLLRDGKPRKVTALIAERSDVETPMRLDQQGLDGAELADAPRTAAAFWCARCKKAARRRRPGCAPNDLIVGVGRTPIANTPRPSSEAPRAPVFLVLNVRRGSPHN